MPLTRHDYTVACICALGVELAPVKAMLDRNHPSLPTPRGQNSYVLGDINEHNIVIAVLPEIGTSAAATVATQLLNDFPAIRFGLMVGIGGGIPDLQHGVDIRLGDVVVSKPTDISGGVIQYDLGKETVRGFERTGTLSKPPELLRAAVQRLVADHERVKSQVPTYISRMVAKFPEMETKYSRPLANDQLFKTSYSHQGGMTCVGCDVASVIDRPRRSSSDPVIHYGTVGSANRVVKNAVERDKLKAGGRGILCVEMEAAGLMDSFPCIVIRGICDYADSHKNKDWQPYAAAAAAAYMKELLSVTPVQEVTTVTLAGVVRKISQYDKGLNLFGAPDMGESLFVGRNAELLEMASYFDAQSLPPNASRKVLVLGGVGGIGKTQLSIAYAKRHRASHTSAFWLNATSDATVRKSLRTMANRLFPVEMISNLDDDQVWIQLSNWLSELDNNRWLLIFDNHDNPGQFDITTFYPSVAHGSIIVTTRTPQDVLGEIIKVQHMVNTEDGVQILASRSGRSSIHSDPGSRPLAYRLAGFPLALATAGAFLKQSPIDCTTYLKRYDEVWQVSYTRVSQLPEYPSRTLYTTWNLSLTQIEDEMPLAAQLLRFLAYLDHQNIWYELLGGHGNFERPSWFQEVTSDKFIFGEAMMVLTRYCLVETHYETDSYSLHACVHDWTLDGLNRQINWSHYWLAFDCVAQHIRVDDWDFLSMIRYQRFVGHAARLVHSRFQAAAGEQDSILNRLVQIDGLACLLHGQVQLDGAEQMCLLGVAVGEKALGPDHTSTLLTVNNLGNLYSDQGRLAEAEQMFNRALAGYEKVLNPDHILILDTVNNLGNLYSEQDRIAEAEQMYNRALAGYEKGLSPNHKLTLNTVNNLGNLYSDQGRLAEAEQMYNRALAGYKKVLGLDHKSTLNTLSDLGNLYSDQGRLVEAEQMYNHALDGYEKVMSPDHTSTLDTVSNLANLYSDQGRLAEAEQMFNRALAGYEKVLGSDHKSTLNAVHDLGHLYSNQGRLAEAEQMYSRALAGFEKVLGPDHTSTLLTKVAMGNLQCLQRHLSEAEKRYQKAISGFQRVLRPNHIYLLGTTNNMGNLYSMQRKWDKAKEMYEQAAAGMSQLLGKDHYFISGVFNNLGLLHAERGDSEIALRMYEEARHGFERSLGSTHPLTKMVRYNIGWLKFAKTQVGVAILNSDGGGYGLERVHRRWYY